MNKKKGAAPTVREYILNFTFADKVMIHIIKMDRPSPLDNTCQTSVEKYFLYIKLYIMM